MNRIWNNLFDHFYFIWNSLGQSKWSVGDLPREEVQNTVIFSLAGESDDEEDDNDSNSSNDNSSDDTDQNKGILYPLPHSQESCMDDVLLFL
jgi:hypothetical protein